MLLGVLDLVEVQLDRLGETAQRLRDRAALAGHIDLEALRHVPVFFLVYGSGEVSRRIHNPQCGISPILRLPNCTRCGQPGGAEWLSLARRVDSTAYRYRTIDEARSGQHRRVPNPVPRAPPSRFVVQRDDDLRNLPGHDPRPAGIDPSPMMRTLTLAGLLRSEISGLPAPMGRPHRHLDYRPHGEDR